MTSAGPQPPGAAPATRCSEFSAAAGEPLSATAPTATEWLLVEVAGPWPRDVSAGASLPEEARERVGAWLDAAPARKLLFVRRPGREGRPLAFAVRAEETAQEVRRIELGDLDDLARVGLETVGTPVGHPLVLVCGHGTRDGCCALHGTAVYRSLEPHLGREELWLSSHHGGHRFAANVLVLPASLHFGRVAPEEARDVVSRALSGRIELSRYRGRTCYEPELQAAEHAVRTSFGLDRVDALRAVAFEGALARLRGAGGTEYVAVVEGVDGPPVPASCGAEPEPQRRLDASVLEASAA